MSSSSETNSSGNDPNNNNNNNSILGDKSTTRQVPKWLELFPLELLSKLNEKEIQSLVGLVVHKKEMDGKCKPLQKRDQKTNGPCRVISFDGGGIRTILQCVIMADIVEKYHNFLDQVDVFAGSSAGALVATLFILGYLPRDVVNIMSMVCSNIFGQPKQGMESTSSATYSNDLIQAVFYLFLGDTKLTDLNRSLVVPALQLAFKDNTIVRWVPRLFHNMNPTSSQDEPLKCTDTPTCSPSLELPDGTTKLKVSDLLLRTLSVPGAFPSHQGYIDGGIFCNNPSMAAVSLASNFKRVGTDRIVCLSFGSGLFPRAMDTKPEVKDHNMPLSGWQSSLADMYIDSSTELVHQLTGTLLSDRYHRFNPILEQEIKFDNTTEVAGLVDLAQSVVINDQWIQEHWTKTTVSP
ncbi:hypothetical protein DFA_05085 [Cavenderia fasciculata]|uniref:PNPLA domain-containing protein n=1 Tax=Cavenderia fasciculata TaxID=261658 RepID=F4PNA2_CACFS|nr:uncharacterized protein DFA_05085 [Cavenderia fasciculata]EGG22955.1 hypothetical protein DFA_05085 [Cavenderia fasciculata]|eukprot:XP_004360806.1 hypothetical protein DFA_05085 [Cavenderia fasciculata]